MDINNVKVDVGFAIKSKRHGNGKCTKVDPKTKAFRYLFKFEDGTLKWMSDKDVENVLSGKEKPWSSGDEE